MSSIEMQLQSAHAWTGDKWAITIFKYPNCIILSNYIFFILTLRRRHTDVLSEERAPNSASLDPLGYRLGYLLDAQVDQLTQGKRHNHV